MFAIYDKNGKPIVSKLSTKTKAWNAFLLKRVGYVSENRYIRASYIAGYRRDGFYCDTFAAGGTAPKAAPATTTSPTVAFTHKVVKDVSNSFKLDLAFAKAMHKFFKAKQDAGEIEYIYEYKHFGSEGDAKKLLQHMTEFLENYKG